MPDLYDLINETEGSEAAPGATPTPGASPRGAAPTGTQHPAGAAAPIVQPLPPAKNTGVVQSVSDFIGNLLQQSGQGAVSRGTALRNSAGTGPAIAAGVLRAPGQLIGGALDTNNEAGKFILNNMSALAVRGYQAAGAKAPQALQEQAKSPLRPKGASLADTLSGRASLGQVGDPGINQFVAENAASMIPATGIESAAGRVAAVAAGAGLSYPAEGPNPLGQRLEHAEVGAAAEMGLSAVGAIAAKVLTRGKLPTQVLRATPEEAAKDHLDRAFATARTEEARAQQAALDAGQLKPDQLAPQEVTPPGRHDDVPVAAGDVSGVRPGGASSGEPKPPVPAVVHDANSVLEKVGAAERIPEDGTHRIAPDGRIFVEQETKDLLDQTPFGRAFTSEEEQAQLREREAKAAEAVHQLGDGTEKANDFVQQAGGEGGQEGQQEGGRAARAIPAEAAAAEDFILKEQDSAGGARVVWRSTPQDIHGFLAKAASYAKAAEETTPEAALDIKPGDAAAQDVGQWKLSNLGSPEDVAPVGRALADELKDFKQVTTTEDIQRLAKQLGQDPATVSAVLHELSNGAEPTMAHTLVVRTMAAQTNRELSTLADRDWTQVDAASGDFQDALRVYHNALTWAQFLQRAKYSAGRVLKQFQMPLDALGPLGGTPPVDVPDLPTWSRFFGKGNDVQSGMAGDVPLPRNPQEFQDALDLYKYLEAVGKGDQFFGGKAVPPDAWKYLRTSFANWFSASVVSAPSTFMRDLISPAILHGMRTLERTIGGYGAALTEATIGDATRVPELIAEANAATPAYLRTMGDLWDSFKAGANVVRTNRGLSISAHNPMDATTRNVPQSLIDAARGVNKDFDANLYTMGNAINLFPDAVHRLHGGVNELAFRQSYLSEIRAGATAEGVMRGLSGDALHDHVTARVMGAEDPLINYEDDPLWARSRDFALRTTFTKRVGDDLQPGVRATADWVEKMREAFPEFQLLLPIFRVPANSIGEVLRRVPVLGQTFRGTQAELAGSLGAAAQAEAYGRVLTGTSILGLGFLGARAGQLTGKGPSAPGDRAVWLANGNQPYSIRIGNTWMSYNRLDVAGQMLGIIGNTVDQTVHAQTDNPNAIYAAVGSLAELLKDQSALKGISDALTFGGDPGEAQSTARTFANDIARGFVPNLLTSGFRNQLDPLQRTVRTPLDAVRNALPGLSPGLDPVRNVLGEYVYKPQQALGVLPITLSNVNSNKRDDVLAELDRVMVATGFGPGVISPNLGGHVDMRDVKLEDKHSMYDAVQRYRQVVQNDDGQTLREALKDLFQSDDYKDAVDGREDEFGSRPQMISKVFHEFTQKAKEAVANDSETAARYFTAVKAKEGNSAVLGTHPAASLATPAGEALIRSLGIDYDATLDKVKGQ